MALESAMALSAFGIDCFSLGYAVFISNLNKDY